MDRVPIKAGLSVYAVQSKPQKQENPDGNFKEYIEKRRKQERSE